MIQIDNRNIFFEKLKTGINLFTGAVFFGVRKSSE